MQIEQVEGLEEIVHRGNTPAVSVVMPVRNARPFLDASIRSVLAQSFDDFELVLLDDASTDGSISLLRDWAQRDARVRLVEVSAPLGLSGSSNTVVRMARSPIVARMDADDIAHPERLEKQFRIIQSHSEVVLVASLCEGIDSNGRRVRPRDRWRLVRASLYPPFPHGSAMFRREAFEAAGGYQEYCAGWEDQDLFLRLSRIGRVVVLPESLYFYRYHLSNSTGGSPTEHRARLYGVRRLCLEAFRAGGNYDHLLTGAACLNQETPLATAEALYQTGAMRLWAGHPPAILSEVFRGGGLEVSPRALLALTLALWGSISPASLRVALRSFIRGRDLLAGHLLKNGNHSEWRLK